MNLPRFSFNSLRNRVLLLTLAGFLIASVTLAILVVRYLQNDVQKILIQQQQTMVDMVVQRMDSALQSRLDYLEAFAAKLQSNGRLLSNRKIQQRLNSESHLQQLFNGGLVVLNRSGISVVDYPVVKGRTGINFSDRQHLQQARASASSVISRPLIGKGLQTPLFAINTPILDANKKVIGFIFGVNVLARDNVLKNISERAFGNAGQLLIIDPNLEIYVTDSDKGAALTSYNNNDRCSCINQVLSGHSSGITIDAGNQPILYASAEIKQMGWLVIRTYPLQMATSPVDTLTINITSLILALMLFMASFIAYLLKRQLTPLELASNTIMRMASGQQPTHELEIIQQDEVGNLIQSFNELHKTRLDNEQALSDSESRYRMTMEATGTGIWSWDLHLDEISWNSQCFIMLGYSNKEFELNRESFKNLLHPDDRVDFFINFMPQLLGNTSVETEFRLRTKQGGWLWVQSRGRPILFDNHSKPLRIVGTHVNIDKQKQTEQLRLAAAAFETNDAIMIVNAEDKIIKVNNAFCQITGFNHAEVQNQNPRMMQSGIHGNDFYSEMWSCLNDTGHWQGEVWNRRKDGQIFIAWLNISTHYNDNGSVNSRVAVFSDITEKKQSEELIWKQANFDPLTGLPNRRMFLDRLSQEIKLTTRADQSLALLFLDLDRFKEINDTMGHAQGDLLLQEAANRLKKLMRSSDTVARLGGDEFTVILPQIDSSHQVERVVDKMLTVLAEPITLDQQQVYVTASIGVTLYPQDGDSSDQLIQNADQAMYAAKERGRNQMHYFTQSMQEDAIHRVEIIKNLRKAIEEEQFELYFQPIVDMKSGNIHKAEALIRWHHPDGGIIMPDAFIPIAEESGLIQDIGNWTVSQAIGQVKQWRQNLDPLFQLSINTSPVHFENSLTNTTLESWLIQIEEAQISGQAIAIEITEGLLMDQSKETQNKLLSLRDANIQVALDDFGTGHSSLAYLNRFDIDYLKIDRSFVCNLQQQSNDLALCNAIIVMAHTLGLKVIAEGIETEQQRDLLAQAGCDFGQGFLYAKPLPAEQFEQCIKDLHQAIDTPE
ncbi:EAL domain-containing protein [Amphritea sp. HPY]|uniref:bifunctional diguanylate cyclase/phosphodiesterase n=1 Tax=Amphritea sp. HPY TaxID=3421652 RepID=UPI003D7C9755